MHDHISASDTNYNNVINAKFSRQNSPHATEWTKLVPVSLLKIVSITPYFQVKLWRNASEIYPDMQLIMFADREIGPAKHHQLSTGQQHHTSLGVNGR